MNSDRLASRVLNAGDLRTVQRVFREIVAEPWFVDEPYKRHAFGAILLRAYFQGLTDSKKLREYGLEVAKSGYHPRE